MDATNLLKPLLSSGDIRCIGSTTFQEFRGIFEKDRALARRFQKVDVSEPSVEDTIGILRGLKGRFEQHHSIEYSDEALRAAAELASRYINDRHMPDKAIDVIDEAGAYQRLQPVEQRVKRIEVPQVEDIVAKIARIPPKHVNSSDKELLRNLERDLKLTDHAHACAQSYAQVLLQPRGAWAGSVSDQNATEVCTYSVRGSPTYLPRLLSSNERV